MKKHFFSVFPAEIADSDNDNNTNNDNEFDEDSDNDNDEGERILIRRGFRGGAGRAAAPPFAGIFVRDLYEND